jgi:thioredoxin-like negative regulator of GroEL
MTAVTHLTFTEFVSAHRFAVVHFWACWNGYDPQMKAFIETEVPQDLRDQIAFASLDTDPPEHHSLCRAHHVLNLPFLVLYKNGALMTTVTGMQKQNILRLFADLVTASE